MASGNVGGTGLSPEAPQSSRVKTQEELFQRLTLEGREITIERKNGGEETVQVPVFTAARDTFFTPHADPNMPVRRNGARWEPMKRTEEVFGDFSQGLRTELLTQQDNAEVVKRDDPFLLGRIIGEALQERAQILRSNNNYEEVEGGVSVQRDLFELARVPLLQLNFERVPSLEQLPSEYVLTLSEAAELIRAVQYARQSGQEELLRGFHSGIGPEVQESFHDIIQLSKALMGPRILDNPRLRTQLAQGEKISDLDPVEFRTRHDEAIGPDLLSFSHGGGDFGLGIMRLVLRGGRPLHFRAIMKGRSRESTAAINHEGRYSGRIYNREGDFAVEATYAGTPTAEILQRMSLIHFLNVPSTQLPDVLSDQFIDWLPQGAILASAIGGLRPGRARSLLPHEYVRARLADRSRDDVLVSETLEDTSLATMAGYLRGKDLEAGVPLHMDISAREHLIHKEGSQSPIKSRSPRESAFTLAAHFTNRRESPFRNDFIDISLSHWDRSNNLGKVAKNIFTLGAGYEGADLALGVAREIREGNLTVGSSDFETKVLVGSARFTEVREAIWSDMTSLLSGNEVGIKPIRQHFTKAVETDFRECSALDFKQLVHVMGEALKVDVDSFTVQDYRQFLLDHVVNPNKPVAATRNTRRGVAQKIYEAWREMGMKFNIGEIMPTITEEGVNSLEPVMTFYNNPMHPIARRRLPDRVYRWVDVFKPDSQLAIPPRLSPEIVEALEDRVVGVKSRDLELALKGQTDESVQLISKEIRRLKKYRSQFGGREDGAPVSENVQLLIRNQEDLVRRLIAVSKDGVPLRVVRSPYLQDPYQNLFSVVVQMENGEISHRPFIRMDLNGIEHSVHHLGIFLRSFPPGSHVAVEVKYGPHDPSNTEFRQLKDDLENVAREILTAHSRFRPGLLGLEMGDKTLEARSYERPVPEDSFYEDLRPLYMRVMGLEKGSEVSQKEIKKVLRTPRRPQTALFESFLQDNKTWPMLLGKDVGSPLNIAIKENLSRPEKGLVVGLYDGETMVDAFTLYRGEQTPMVLMRYRMEDLAEVASEMGRGKEFSLQEKYNGLPLEEFLKIYDAYSERMGRSDVQPRVMELNSHPLEDALSGRVSGIQPINLRIYLARPQEELSTSERTTRDHLIQSITELYRLDHDSAHEALRNLVQVPLSSFMEENPEYFADHPLKRHPTRPGALSRWIKPRENGSSPPSGQ